LPLEKVKTDLDIQRKIEDYSNVEVKASAIQARLMKKASKKQQFITHKNVSTKQHIYNTKHKMMMAELPTSMNLFFFMFIVYACSFNYVSTGDFMKNLQLLHSPHFLWLMQFEPGNSFVFMGDSGLSVLAGSNYVIVDRMFNLVEEKLVLTTLMEYHDGIAIPFTYYLSDLKTHKSYLKYFRYLVTAPFFIQNTKYLSRKSRIVPMVT
jgi:hypothetical protein